jgi:alpha-1,3-rhamnosyl/mannosyltransferase
MRVFIDARVIQDHFPGIGRYAFNLIDALAPLLDGELLVLADARAANTRYDLARLTRHPNVQFIETDIPVFHWHSQTALPGLIRSHAPDVVHFPYNVRPLRVGIPSLLTLYDVIPRRFPEYYPGLSRRKVEAIQRAALRASDRFVAISHSTADDFAELYGIGRERITVTPLAPDPVFHPRALAELDAFRQHKHLPENYCLYLGSNKPHKNLPRLVQAWARASEKLKVKSGKLIIAGHWDERYPQAKELAASLGVSDSVRFLGPVPGEELPLLMAAADVFIFPSLYEGFGLPVLEAMASGVPVACSRAPGLTEVAGDAALTFDPASVEEMTGVILQLLADETLREQLRQQGLERAAAFSWQETARLTLSAYQKLVTGR